jgi:hypothetical protein
MSLHGGAGLRARLNLAAFIIALAASCAGGGDVGGEGEGEGAGEGEGEGACGLPAAGVCRDEHTLGFCVDDVEKSATCAADQQCHDFHNGLGVSCGTALGGVCADTSDGLGVITSCVDDGAGCVIDHLGEAVCVAGVGACSDGDMLACDGDVLVLCFGIDNATGVGRVTTVDCLAFDATCASGAGCVVPQGAPCVPGYTVCRVGPGGLADCPADGSCPG